MKEMTTIRLYEDPQQQCQCDSVNYRPAPEVKGWNYARGDQIGLYERNGGYLMGAIDHIDPEVHEDDTGRFKTATIWTLD